jgi:LysM repeat protein
LGDRLAELKTKYQSVLTVIEQQRVHLRNVHVENDKLLIRGDAPSQDSKNMVWDQIKLIDPNYHDVTVEIAVSQAAPSEAKGEVANTTSSTYTVQSGDTLSGISKRFYGDASQYMKIFNANKDQLKDPDKIQSGQKLVIPAR